MKQVPCNFTAKTGIPVFADDRFPPDRLAVFGLARKVEQRPDGSKVVHRLEVQSISIAPALVD